MSSGQLYGTYRNYMGIGTYSYVCSLGTVGVLHIHLNFLDSAMQRVHELIFFKQALFQHCNSIGKWKC